MKLKKILFSVLAIAASVMLSAGIAACDDKDESSSVGADSAVASSTVQNSSNTQNDGSSTATNTEGENTLRFKTFTVDGNNVVAPQAFSNATTEFSFLEEIEASENVKFEVAADKYGAQTYLTKIVPLAEGDNTFYVFEMQDGEVVQTYTVTIRRRPMYTVYFYANGGTAVESQTIEEGYCASAPTTATTRVGYTFDKWDYDFTQPITGYTSINAVWTANADTPYKVEYYLQNLEDYGYTLETTENKTGTTDATATAEIKTFEHFTHNEMSWESRESGNINGDGSTVLKVYYTRNRYRVTVTAENYKGSVSGSGVYANAQQVTLSATINAGYTFDGWYNGDEKVSSLQIYSFNPTENISLVGKWTANTNTPYKVEYYLQNLDDNGYTLNTTENKTGYDGRDGGG